MATDSTRSRSFFDNPWVRTAGVLAVVVGLAVLFASLDLEPDLSHLKVRVLSGSTQGNYYAVMERARTEAAKQKGEIENVSTKGSIDNLDRLVASAESCEASFGLAQDGLPWPEGPLEVVARLPVAETVLFLGLEAEQIGVVADLEGKRIGIGPEGSGTENLARALFDSRGFQHLTVSLENHAIADQLAMIQSGELDLAVFVIAAGADLVDTAVREQGLQIASFEHARSIAEHLPIVRSDVMPAGYYDPFLVLPREPRHVLVVDTLLLGNGCASRTETMGMLSLLETVYPSLTQHNLTHANQSGLPDNDAAQTNFQAGGPDLLDRYAPWLADWIPMANLIQLAMVMSVLANLMTLWHRYRLWQIDATRAKLERDTKDALGTNVSDAIRVLPIDDADASVLTGTVDRLVGRFEEQRDRIRRQAQSMLVPMGQELLYRHQESLVEDRLTALQTLQDRLRSHTV